MALHAHSTVLSPSVQVSDWEEWPLTRGQVRYAAHSDAFLPFQIKLLDAMKRTIGSLTKMTAAAAHLTRRLSLDGTCVHEVKQQSGCYIYYSS
jgi:ribonuclease D